MGLFRTHSVSLHAAHSRMRRSVILLPSIMKGTKGIHHSDVHRIFLLIGIITSLCFSAGEGLRLTPFPADNVTRISLIEILLSTSGSCETSPTRYGPITLPKPTQARSTHKASDSDGLSEPIAVNPSPRFVDLLLDEASKVASLQLISRARDRAPPLSPTT